MLLLERRPVDSSLMRWASPVLALVLTVITGFVLFLAMGKDPVEGLTFFFITPISDLIGLAELGLKMAPLLLCAAGLTVCYRAKLWNIGAEGHFLMGAWGPVRWRFSWWTRPVSGCCQSCWWRASWRACCGRRLPRV